MSEINSGRNGNCNVTLSIVAELLKYYILIKP